MKVTLENITFLIFIFYLPTVIFARIGHSKQSYCLDEIKSGTISLGCASNQLIKLGRVIYGYSWSNDCSYIDKDCTMDVPRDDIICLTTTNCTVRVVEHPLILQDCWNLAASYVQAEFECIAEYSLQNVCQPQDTTLTYGFLSTPNYPHGFSSNLNCPCALFASPGHAIVLEVIDFRLPTCAEAGLILWLGQDFQTKCLTQDPLTVVSNVQQNVTLRFYTLANIKHGGFLIKYSVLPLSNNATIRLQCYVAPAVSRAPVATNVPTINLSQQPLEHIPVMKNEMTISVDQRNNEENSPSSPLDIIHSNDLIKRFPSDHNVIPPILGMPEEHKDYTSLMGVNKQQPNIHGLNQSMYKRYLLPNSMPSNRSNMTLIITCVVAGVIFLLIMINALIWFIFSLRPSRSKSTTSFQNLYPHPTATATTTTTTTRPPPPASTETKSTTSTNPTPIYPRRHHHHHHHPTQSSVRLDTGSTLSNQLQHGNQMLPETTPSNHLRPFRSLLFRSHKTLGIDSMTNPNEHYRYNRDFDSTLSEYQIRSITQSVFASQLPKSRYEEQEDCVELKSECSVLTNHNHGLINRTKPNQERRQINSWDDI